ncbi:hypothetical protein Tsubulata_005656 [Turnera subulata]|uniref:CHCH domain-containing protein n=1 Tax=Turnera subulata TaxID=218843 RepID=A0A9Q0F2G1_9ROSI|nr:hypothetical protein Tsubulata_005656 [Turnera subulata]
MEKTTPKPECAKETLDLLNCVTASPYDVGKCMSLLHELRRCVVDKAIGKQVLGSPWLESSAWRVFKAQNAPLSQDETFCDL